MGNERAIRQRSKNDLARHRATQKARDRVLIVTEGTKTEPNYFKGIRSDHRLHTASIQVLPCDTGTDPIHVVNRAEELLLEGDPSLRIEGLSFDRVYAVFDRDDHPSFSRAIK